MAQKHLEERIANTEQSMNEMKKELQRLPVVERSVERLPGMEKSLEKLSDDVRGLHQLVGRLIRELPVEKGKKIEETAEIGESEVQTREGEATEDNELDEWLFGETSRQGHHNGVNRIEVRKLEMPVYTGGDPDNWLFRTEHFFQLQSLTDIEKLKAAIVSFDAEAIEWFRYTYNRRKIKSWEELKRRMILRFRADNGGGQCGQFLRVKQTGTIADYRRQFEALSAPLPHLSDEILESTFLNGLEPEMQREVLSLSPNGLEEMWRVARLVENRMQPYPDTSGRVGVKITREDGNHERGWTTRAVPSRTVTVNERIDGGPFRRKPPEFKRMSDAEMRFRREKGLCFKCDEKFVAGHRCRNREFRLLFVDGEEEEDGTGREEEDDASKSYAAEARHGSKHGI